MAYEHYLRYPGEQTYYRILAPVMGFICLNTQYWSWYSLPKSKLCTIHRFIVFFFAPITDLSQIVYLALNYKYLDFAILAVILSIIPIGFNIWLKMVVAQQSSYKQLAIDLMDKIHIYNIYAQKCPDEVKQNFVKEMLIKIEKNTRYTLCLNTVLAVICYSSWMTVPIIHNVRNNESIHNITVRLEMSIYLWQPFDYEYNFYAYLFEQTIVCYCGFIAVVTLVTFDSLMLTFIYHLVGHIKILKYDLEKAKTETLSNDEWKQKLVNITDTYLFITTLLKSIEEAFGINMLIIYAQNLFQGGLLLFQMTSESRTTETYFTFGLLIPIIMGTLSILSIVLEDVRIQAEEIPSLVYDLPWESMSIPNQKIVRSILFQVQPTLECKAAFNIKTGVQPAINIFKTVFSYYVMIKAKTEEE